MPSWWPTSYSAQMCGWESCEIVFRLALEPLANLADRRHVLRQHFHRDRPLQPRVPRLVDLPHPSRAQRRQDLVGTEARTGCERHGAPRQFKRTRNRSESKS